MVSTVQSQRRSLLCCLALAWLWLAQLCRCHSSRVPGLHGVRKPRPMTPWIEHHVRYAYNVRRRRRKYLEHELFNDATFTRPGLQDIYALFRLVTLTHTFWPAVLLELFPGKVHFVLLALENVHMSKFRVNIIFFVQKDDERNFSSS